MTPAKQCLEIAQMLAVVAHERGLPPVIRADGEPYGIAHAHHPITRWMCEDIAHASRACAYAYACMTEHWKRYGTVLKAWDSIRNWEALYLPCLGHPTTYAYCGQPFASFRGPLLDVVRAYRKYFRSTKAVDIPFDPDIEDAKEPI